MNFEPSTRTSRRSYIQPQPSSSKIHELSVKCPQFYKDSVSADLIESLCPSPQQKVLIIAANIESAEWFLSSDYLKTNSVIIHSALDRRERIRIGRQFQQSNQKKCLILGSIHGNNLRKVSVRLIIFTFPPQNLEFYQSVIDLTIGVEYIAISYSTKQINKLCKFQAQLKRKFTMLAPPEVESDPDEEEKMCNQQKFDPFQNKLVIKNITGEYNWKDLKNFLELHNIHTIEVRLIQSSRFCPKSPSIKTGFIVCRDKKSYESAVTLNGIDFHGNELRVYEYTPNK